MVSKCFNTDPSITSEADDQDAKLHGPVLDCSWIIILFG